MMNSFATQLKTRFENEELLPVSGPNPRRLKADCLDLKKTFEKEGLFRASPVFYGVTGVSAIAILAFALFALSFRTWLGFTVSLALFGIYYPQLAFLGHDFAHYQVFSSKFQKWNRVFGGIIFGNLLQGFSFVWWKQKHDTHHATPNLYKFNGDKLKILDSDLDTAPLLIWDEKLLTEAQRRKFAPWIRVQKYFFGFLLTVARVSWAIQNFYYAAKAKSWHEIVLMALHYIAIISLISYFGRFSVASAIGFWLLANFIGGGILAWVFVLSHSGKDVFEQKSANNYYETQVRTTRNVTSNFAMDWFTGGLNLQLEHHLFPTLPRHNLGKIKARVKEVVERNGYEYEMLGVLKATHTVYRLLPDGKSTH